MIGQLVGMKYEILSELESSPLFASYRAMDRTTGRDVRIRKLEPSYCEDASFVEALRQHASRVRAINHPSLEKFTDVVEDDGQFALISEYTLAMTLDERVKRLASFSVQLAVGTAVSVCEAVVVVHQAGLVHGDISGRNVLITSSGAVKLTMAGFWSTFASSSKAGLVMLRSMAPYLAPEITSGSMPSNATDIYSIGILLYLMLAGRCPYSGDSTVAIATKHATAPYPSLRTVNPAVPEALDELVKKCVSKSPSERYANVGDLLADLRGIQDALRFGRPLTWPIRREPIEAKPVAPIVETAEPEQKQRTKPNQAKPEKQPRRKADSDDFPKWLTGVVVVFVAAFFAALGGWAWFNTHQPKLIDLPNVVNKEKMQAANELKKLGLTLHVEKQQASEKYPAGVIISQDPEPGRKMVKEGGIVQVVVSAGGRFVELPDLRGRTEEEAKKLLEALNLELSSKVEKVRDKDLPAGMVVSQVPEPRKKLERGSKVKIRVSNGNKAVEGEESGDQRYTYKLKITMPPGAASILVRIDMTDNRGTQTILEEAKEPSEAFTVEQDGYGKEALFRVFFDNELVKQVQKTADESDRATGGEQQ